MRPHTKEKRKRYHSSHANLHPPSHNRIPEVQQFQITFSQLLWKLTKSQQREWACYSKLDAHPKILLAEHLVGLSVTFPNLRAF